MNRGQQPVQTSATRQPSAEGRAGSFLLLTAVATLVMVYGPASASAGVMMMRGRFGQRETFA